MHTYTLDNKVHLNTEEKKKIKALVKSLALTAGLVASFSSSADFMDFQVDERPYGGEIITADKFNGGYTETVTFDGQGNFVSTAIATFGQLFSNEGTALTAQTGSVIGAGYQLYALFEASGTFTSPGEFGSDVSFRGDSGSFSLYLDAEQDLEVNLIGETGFEVASTDGDIFLGSSEALLNNIGLYNDVPKLGGVTFFEFQWGDFELTTEGEKYFVAPTPFHNFLITDGDFDVFEFNDSQRTTGDISAVFIPEPSTIAILALGLLSLGATSRRKS